MGSGGFQTTYKAWDHFSETTVAIREFFPLGLCMRGQGKSEVIVFQGDNKTEYDKRLESFSDTARSNMQFSSCSIVIHVSDLFTENNTAYSVGEYVDGHSLKDYLKKNGKIALEEAIRITDLLLDGIREIMEIKNCVFSLHPGEIYLLGTGLKITYGSFGIDNGLTRAIIIEPGYSPPEDYRGKGERGIWSVIYEVAAVFYQMLTGLKPDESTDRMVEDHVEEPCKLNPEVSPELSNTIMMGMALKPKDRFQTITDFKDAIHGRIRVERKKSLFGKEKWKI